MRHFIIVYYNAIHFSKIIKDNPQELSAICKITASDLLERNATPQQKQQGLDLADYLVGCKK
ncbi:MAG: hypothetical protein ACHQII_04400 [Bacteroidia bacterium]